MRVDPQPSTHPSPPLKAPHAAYVTLFRCVQLVMGRMTIRIYFGRRYAQDGSLAHQESVSERMGTVSTYLLQSLLVTTPFAMLPKWSGLGDGLKQRASSA